MAWDVFGEQNGCEYEDDFRRMILDYRPDKFNYNPSIGCIVLTNPLFFEDQDFIPVPENWSKSIVQGKGMLPANPSPISCGCRFRSDYRNTCFRKMIIKQPNWRLKILL
ncbi:MAG: hypothetical protein IPP71_09920 [Bacteroidetes bacterium]|nr:hypothetical protein [Bacteroidota bacterium]